MLFICIFFTIVFVAVAIIIWYRLTIKYCRCHTCLVGKTALVTGGSSGIGYYTALDFAKRGARVILTSRTQTSADRVRKSIIEETGNQNVVAKQLDVTTFAAVRLFAADIIKNEDRLDILVNNAGIGLSNEELTEDGCGELIQVNYFSMFLLTNLLLEKLKETGCSRIINLSSIISFFVVNLDLDRIKTVRHFFAYGASKYAVNLFTGLLAKKLRGSNVTVYSLHPGYVATPIWLRGSYFLLLLAKLFMNSEEGAQGNIHLSVAKGIEKHSGGHFHVFMPLRYWNANKHQLAENLWKKSEEVVNQKF